MLACRKLGGGYPLNHPMDECTLFLDRLNTNVSIRATTNFAKEKTPSNLWRGQVGTIYSSKNIFSVAPGLCTETIDFEIGSKA